jgi:hypothetical protein
VVPPKLPAAATDAREIFAERLLQVIDEGRRMATYKLALLLALIDASAEEADKAGLAPAQTGCDKA